MSVSSTLLKTFSSVLIEALSKDERLKGKGVTAELLRDVFNDVMDVSVGVDSVCSASTPPTVAPAKKAGRAAKTNDNKQKCDYVFHAGTEKQRRCDRPAKEGSTFCKSCCDKKGVKPKAGVKPGLAPGAELTQDKPEVIDNQMKGIRVEGDDSILYLNDGGYLIHTTSGTVFGRLENVSIVDDLVKNGGFVHLSAEDKQILGVKGFNKLADGIPDGIALAFLKESESQATKSKVAPKKPKTVKVEPEPVPGDNEL